VSGWYKCRLFIKFDKPEPIDVRRILISLLALLFCFFSVADNGVHAKPEPYFNWINIWLSFFFGVLFTILFRLLNKNSRTGRRH
jgi:peptidoglycan/LPS O-acetylase OafA/YrhL